MKVFRWYSCFECGKPQCDNKTNWSDPDSVWIDMIYLDSGDEGMFIICANCIKSAVALIENKPPTPTPTPD